MSDEIKEEKETTEDWEEFVRSEVAAALDEFLPYSTDGKLGIMYTKSIKENTEAGPVYESKKKAGVEIVIALTFGEALEV